MLPLSADPALATVAAVSRIGWSSFATMGDVGNSTDFLLGGVLGVRAVTCAPRFTSAGAKVGLPFLPVDLDSGVGGSKMGSLKTGGASSIGSLNTGGLSSSGSAKTGGLSSIGSVNTGGWSSTGFSSDAGADGTTFSSTGENISVSAGVVKGKGDGVRGVGDIGNLGSCLLYCCSRTS